ncbi:hypothetical protein [Actinomadura formosensis]
MDSALDLIVEGLLAQLPAELLTAMVIALVTWAVRRRRKSDK